MNEARRRPPVFLAALAAAVVMVAGCGQGGQQAGGPPLAGAKLGGPFALTDQDGRRVTDKAYAGRYRIVYFGYTFCPDVCPTTLQTLMRGLSAFKASSPSAAARIGPIFISVDPARDTPPVMKQYVAAFGPDLIGLTGGTDEIATVAKAYGVYYKAAPAAGTSGYLVDHSSQPVLFGPDGAPIALLPADLGADAVAKELKTWVR